MEKKILKNQNFRARNMGNLDVYIKGMGIGSIRLFLTGLYFFCSAHLVAVAQDSLYTLSPEAYLQLVRQYHPVVKQAGLQVEMSRAQLLESRGLFDPLVYFNNDRKTFDGTNYFNYNHLALKVPTWLGIEVMAGLENNLGDRLINEVTLNQSSYAGLSVPLAKNLLMDSRRAALAQAKLMINLSINERQLIINDLLFDAMDAYWLWARDYQLYAIITETVRINELRYQNLKVTVEQGDRAGVDSTEALTQLLQFQLLQNEALVRFNNAGYFLSNFLWNENGRPLDLAANITPAINFENLDPGQFPVRPLSEWLETAQAMHPKLQMFDMKLDWLEVERRLKFQSLLPTVNLKYNALSKGYEFWKGWNTTTLENNYKFGVDVGLPLFFRSGRGAYRNTKLKIQDTQFELDLVNLEIENKVEQYYNELTGFMTQLRIAEQSLNAFQQVFRVEMMKFEVGESNVFLLNARENKVLETRQKVADLKAKFFKTLYAVQWAAGVLQ